MNFEDVLGVVRETTGRTIAVPEGANWGVVDQGGDGVVVTLELPRAALGENLQQNRPASPAYALCIAWWFEHATGRPARVAVRLVGPAPTAGPALLHLRRGQFFLHELATLLGPRLTVTPDPGWVWPERPVLNAPLITRPDTHHHDPLSEHALEVFIAGNPALAQAFPAPITGLARQLPVGLFAGEVSRATAWTPGGASQVDLWGRSPDGDTLHLLELKRSGNTAVGIVPEAFTYARLLHHARLGRIAAPGIPPAKRVVMWLVAPDYHPLVHLHGQSPLSWINAAMAQEGVELRILPIAIDPAGGVTWRAAETWPAVA